jgi:hypothetical protein
MATIRSETRNQLGIARLKISAEQLAWVFKGE